MATTQSTISSAETTTLKGTVATTAGVASTQIKNFVVSISPARRRRRLLTSYAWAVSFDVVAALSSTSASSPAAFSNSVTSSLEANLATNVQADLSLSVTVSAITAVVATRKPSPEPSVHPSVDALSPPTGSEASSSSSMAGAILGAVAGVVCLCGAGVFFKLRADRLKAEQTLENEKQNTKRPSSMQLPASSSTTSSVELVKTGQKTSAFLQFSRPKRIMI
jgi:hypothetical protein